MKLTKDFHSIKTEGNILVGLGINYGEGTISNIHVIFESDVLQDVINDLLNVSILDFSIPVKVSKPENVPAYYLNRIFSDNVITKYENGEPVVENKVLTGYVEMSKKEKEKVDSDKWTDIFKDRKYKLKNTDYPVSIPDYGRNQVEYTDLDKSIIIAKKILLRDVKTDYTNPWSQELANLLDWYSWGIDKAKIDYLK